MEWNMWKPIETAPKDETVFLAAVHVYSSVTDKWHWEYALLSHDEGRFQFVNYADTGWDTDDYTHWQAITPPEQTTT